MKTIRNPRDRAELVRRLRTLTPQSTRRWGRMTSHQMVCHLCDLWRVAVGERTTTPVGNPLAHTVIKWVMLYTPVPPPKEVPTTPELDQEGGGTAPGEFAADVETLIALMERSAAPSPPEPNDHPFFGQLSLDQWGRFNYKHMDHHLRQFGV
ncbi:MAG TPA: DUF1569 domain-containing protein [Gemmatimonadaceae bacterium]